MAWDGEFLGVRGDFGTGGAGHDVWEGAEMAMIFPSPSVRGDLPEGGDGHHVREGVGCAII